MLLNFWHIRSKSLVSVNVIFKNVHDQPFQKRLELRQIILVKIGTFFDKK